MINTKPEMAFPKVTFVFFLKEPPRTLSYLYYKAGEVEVIDNMCYGTMQF
jgi:hypothetical protein